MMATEVNTAFGMYRLGFLDSSAGAPEFSPADEAGDRQREGQADQAAGIRRGAAYRDDKACRGGRAPADQHATTDSTISPNASLQNMA